MKQWSCLIEILIGSKSSIDVWPSRNSLIKLCFSFSPVKFYSIVKTSFRLSIVLSSSNLVLISMKCLMVNYKIRRWHNWEVKLITVNKIEACDNPSASFEVYTHVCKPHRVCVYVHTNSVDVHECMQVSPLCFPVTKHNELHSQTSSCFTSV